jgi:hypothetical protein
MPVSGFLIAEKWEDFYHIEVYRNLPPAEWRYKQKVLGYVATTTSGQHQQLFHTESLSIAVFAQTEEMATTLREWTEEALQQQPEEGGRFFFTSIDISKASPVEMFLSPVWQQAFGTTKTPLPQRQAGKLTMGEEEKHTTIRRRLGVAAQTLGISLIIKRSGGNVYFWREDGEMEQPRTKRRYTRRRREEAELPPPDQPVDELGMTEQGIPEESPELGQTPV